MDVILSVTDLKVRFYTLRAVLKDPQHPYTRSLLKTVPDNANPDLPLFSIRGNVPSLLEPQHRKGRKRSVADA